MSDKRLVSVLLIVFLSSPLGTPALHAIGAWSTLADAIWEFEGDQANAQMGHRMTATGDFNNDGYMDLAIGSGWYDGAAENSGMVEVFYGSEQGLSSSPEVTILPPVVNANSFFGEGVAAADVDNDSYDDLIVSMQNYDVNPNLDEGAVFLYYGSGSGLDNTWDWRVTGTVTYAHTGIDVASAGDVNGDDYEDIIIGARRYDACNGGAPVINHAYVFLGSNALVGTTTVASADWYAMGDQCNPTAPTPKDAGFGWNVGSAGDVNGDGYDDIFVGAPLYDSGETDEGKLFVWYGGMNGLGDSGTPSNADWTAESNQAMAYFPDYDWAAVGSGDFDGDGYDDLTAGSRYYDHLTAGDGVALVWYGSDSGLGPNGNPSNSDWLAYGAEGGTQLGSHLRVLSCNGDRFADVLIGGLGHAAGTENGAGMAIVWLGSEDGLGAEGPSTYADWMVEGDQAGSHLGWSLAAGDTDGDSYDDMIIGAPDYDLSQPNAGKVWAFPGEPTVFRENFETGDTLRCSNTVQ